MPDITLENTELQFTINREELLHSLAHINSIVERRNSILILSYVKIEVFDNILQLIATDLDISLIVSLNTQSLKPGSTTVSAQLLYEIIRKLPSNCEITIYLNNNKLVIESGKAKFSLPIIDSEKFPSIQNDTFTCEFDITAIDLINLFGKTRFAMSSEESRYNLNGVYMHLYQNYLCCTATDGHRLAEVRISKPLTIEQEFGIIIPRKTIIEILKIIDGYTDKIINISLSTRKIRFKFEQYLLFSKLVDGTFPNYQEVIPKNNNKIIKLDTATLSAAIDRVSTVIFDKIKLIKFILHQNQLILKAVASDCSDAIEVLDIEYSGNELEIGFNARYLLDMLSCLKDTCDFKFHDNNTAVIACDHTTLDALYIVMPMRV